MRVTSFRNTKSVSKQDRIWRPISRSSLKSTGWELKTLRRSEVARQKMNHLKYSLNTKINSFKQLVTLTSKLRLQREDSKSKLAKQLI